MDRTGNRKGVTLKDVAAAAKVSRATAARALNSYGYVGDDTAVRVLEVADSLGYRANRVAQALRRGKLPLIGFLPGDIQNPFFARIAHDLEAELRKHGHNLVIASSEESVAQERELLESLRSLSVRGFILAPTSASDNQHIVNLAKDGAPIVLIDRVAENVRCDSVVVDNEGGAREAMEYLIANGHRRIALLRDESRIFTAQERFAGYRNALKAHGIGLDESLVGVSRSTVEHAIEATIRLFSRRDRPTALFTVDSLMTQGALLALRSMGLAIPRDVSLVGFDDFDLATFTDPQITVVAQPIAELGPRAAQLLIERLDGKKVAPRHVRFPTRLVVRGSVAPVAKKRLKG
ncbi:LacI family DNA-binding transcriptional regulator [Dongia sedimenti]|uniref:LacI family DNA-binding transcriptional regulator n=1 Tax=Dongia sedimenti TaxID=3064282 RepID=A0ABU0YPZ7_9PROT|nr:LacI family DNA-binding transcriptional regulator [Rhodospirillaceae bacterium R-7]